MTDIISQIKERMLKVSKVRDRYINYSNLNEQFCSGYQHGLDTGFGQSQYTDLDLSNVIHVQRMSGLKQTWAAMLSGKNPTGRARAATDDGLDAFRAETGNHLLEHFRNHTKFSHKVSKTVRYAADSGQAGMKVVYNPEADDIDVENLTVHDYWRDPTNDYLDSRWVIFRKLIDEEQAQDLVDDAKGNRMVATMKLTNALGEEREGVEHIEMFCKPTNAYPNGLWVIAIDGIVIKLEDNPYQFNHKGKVKHILPFFLMNVRDQTNSPYGHTPVIELIPLQRALNEAFSDHLYRLEISKPSLIVPADFEQKIDPYTTHIIPYTEKQPSMENKAFYWTDPPGGSSDIYQLEQSLIEHMMATIGLNDTNAGSAARSQSGAAIDSLLELDEKKNGDCTTSMKSMITEACRFALLIYATKVSDEKKIELTAQTKAAVDLFDETDAFGTDIIVQIDSDNADLDLATIRQPADGAKRNRARQFIKDFIASAYVLPLADDVDPQALVAAADEAKAVALRTGNKAEYQALHALQREAAMSIQPAGADGTDTSASNPLNPANPANNLNQNPVSQSTASPINSNKDSVKPEVIQ